MSANQKQQVKGSKGAGVHSGGMRSEAKKTKVVFKNVLDTPFNIPWPEVSSDNNAIVLDMLCGLMAPIREYHNIKPNKDTTSASAKAKKTKKALKGTSQGNKGGHVQEPSNSALATTNHEPHSKIQPSSASTEVTTTSTSTSLSSPPPAILQSTIIGINAVTRALERSIQNLAAHPSPSAIFLCKGDLAPAHLYSHLGPMIAMLPATKLFPLLRGSEKRLSEALGMQAVGALAIRSGSESKEAEDLVMILERMVEPISVSWLPKLKVPAPSQPLSTTAIATSKSTTTTCSTEPSSTTIVTTQSTSMEMEMSVGVKGGALVLSNSEDTTANKPSLWTPTNVPSIKTSWIPTNIKAIKTTMPIIVKSPKQATTDKSKGQGQQKQKQQKQQQSQTQSNSGSSSSSRKHPPENTDPRRDSQSKKPKPN
ncbi:hypothetical protein EDD11_007935 [Mortierella claussenii]|nr:hypothetical protein EDD11_007935 [Mortierella claussenii]